MLVNGLDQNLGPKFWSAATIAQRWVNIRERIETTVAGCDEESADALESLLFVIDELILDSVDKNENFDFYKKSLEEVSEVLMRSTADLQIQLLVATELQKLLLPT